MIIEAIKKFWKFLGEDTWLSWIVSVVLAFLIVKFIFFPGLSLLLATNLPLVVVESGSMHHPGSFVGNAIGSENEFELWWNEKGDWYKEKGIEESEAKNWPLKTGLEMGDIVVISGYKTPEKGDIIIFNADQKHPIIHRIIDVKEINGEVVYETKGDNNEGQLVFEKDVPKDAVIGRAVFRIPKIGLIKLAFVKLLGIF